jgi:DNA-binding transcriptional LysR family regulator
MIDPHQMRVFLVAAETLNFSRAAERLHMSQPSVTQHIQVLEAHFGTELFIRAGRRLKLTETGQALLPLARQMVSLSLRTDELMDALRNEVHGHLMIGCSTTPGKYILPVLLAEFMRQYPKVQATCHVHSRTLALELLEKGQVDFALSSSIEEFDHNIVFQKFLTDPVILIAPLDHPWSQRGMIEPDELRSARFIFREETAGTYKVTRAKLAQVGINIANLNTALILGNSEAIAIAVQQGVGVGFVSRMVYAHMVEGKVAAIKVNDLDISQDIYLCHHQMHPFTSVQSAFWEFACQPDSQALINLRNTGQTPTTL